MDNPPRDCPRVGSLLQGKREYTGAVVRPDQATLEQVPPPHPLSFQLPNAALGLSLDCEALSGGTPSILIMNSENIC